MKHIKLYEEFGNDDIEVVYMSPKDKPSLRKYNETIAKVVSDDGDTLTLEFPNKKKITEVPKTQVRFIS